MGTRQEGEEFSHTGTKHLVETFVTAKSFIDFQIISPSEFWLTCLGAHTYQSFTLFLHGLKQLGQYVFALQSFYIKLCQSLCSPVNSPTTCTAEEISIARF